jgi:outer membrane protein TolC
LFRAGRKTLGDVLEARLDALSAADAVEQAQIAQGSATVQLYRALGGGWDGAGTVSPAPAKP